MRPVGEFDGSFGQPLWHLGWPTRFDDALRFVASSGLSRYEGAAISCGIKAAIGSWATDGANSPLAFKLRAELAALDVDFLEALSISPELPVDSNQDSCVFDRGWLSIKVRLHRIYQRTGVSNRTQLAAQSFAAE